MVPGDLGLTNKYIIPPLFINKLSKYFWAYVIKMFRNHNNLAYNKGVKSKI